MVFPLHDRYCRYWPFGWPCYMLSPILRHAHCFFPEGEIAFGNQAWLAGIFLDNKWRWCEWENYRTKWRCPIAMFEDTGGYHFSQIQPLARSPVKRLRIESDVSGHWKLINPKKREQQFWRLFKVGFYELISFWGLLYPSVFVFELANLQFKPI